MQYAYYSRYYDKVLIERLSSFPRLRATQQLSSRNVAMVEAFGNIYLYAGSIFGGFWPAVFGSSTKFCELFWPASMCPKSLLL